MHQMELGTEDKFSQLEAIFSRMFEVIFSNEKKPSTTLMSKTHIHILIGITMRDLVWLCLLKQPNSTFPNFIGVTQQSGLLEWANSLSSKLR